MPYKTGMRKALLLPLLVACAGSSTTVRSSSTSTGAAPSSTPRATPRAGEATVARCPERGLAVRVLGSGGPILDDDRASTGYVALVDGEPRLLIDAGGGVALRMAQAGIAPEQLGGILLTHFHVDHTADLIALFKSASFSERTTPMPVIGPIGDQSFPGTHHFLNALLGPEGAYAYLGGYLEARGQPFRLQPREIDNEGASETLEVAGLRVVAVGVPHDPVPALGFVVHHGDARVAFTGDQQMNDARFLDEARGAQLLIAHHAIPEGGQGNNLHATPSQIGALAADAEVGRLVLSHHMGRALAQLDEGLAAIRARYDGPLEMANDLDCYPVR